MLTVFDGLRELNFASIAVRMLVAVICGGIIGVEREYKRRPAGFRTHILICLGAAMTTMTSQYMVEIGYFTDLARLGAQVIAGIGFIGAGTIIVTKDEHIKGLTTAAGLWCSAIVGLAVGSGYVEGGLVTTVLILFTETIFAKFARHLLKRSSDVILYIEFSGKYGPEKVLRVLHEIGLTLLNLEITKGGAGDSDLTCGIFTVRLTPMYSLDYVLQQLQKVKNIVTIQEL